MADSPLTRTATIAPEEDPPERPETASAPRLVRRARPLLLAAGSYLALSLVLWWHVWSSHPTSTTTCGCGDNSLFTWFLEWPAYAISHGLNPLYSTDMFHPTGINLLANTGEVGVGVLLAPVTWIFGPIATLNVALTLAPVLSALAMFVLLRRWVSWTPAAFVGGLFYGFSPFILTSLTESHLMLGLAPIPPLIVACLDELLFRQRRRPVATGVVLGLLVVVQFFLGTELLAIMAICAAIGLVIVVAYGASQPGALRRRWRHACVGLAAGAITAGGLLAYPAWFALAGPAHFSGLLWPKGGASPLFGAATATFKNLVLPAASTPTDWAQLTRIIGQYQGPSLSNQYFGIGAVLVVGAGIVAWRRDRRLWLFGAIAGISVLLALGSRGNPLLPWRLAAHRPLLENIIPDRFVVVTYLAVAVIVGVVVDRTYLAVNRRPTAPRDGPRRLRSAVGTGRHPSWRGAAAGVVVAAVALVPIASYLASTTPITTRPVVLPDWFETVAPHLAGHQVLLVLPLPFVLESPLTWQAVDRMHYAAVGGGGPESDSSRAGPEAKGQAVLYEASFSYQGQAIHPGDIRAVRQALAEWGVTMVVIPDQPNLPSFDRVNSMLWAVGLITAATGQRPAHRASAWQWSAVNKAGPPAVPTDAAFTGCTLGLATGGAAIDRMNSCVLAAAARR